MKFPSAFAALTLLLSHASAQTYSKCNPTEQTCSPDPALGTTSDTDFTSGESDDYTPTGDGVSYDSDGVALTVAKQGDNPTLTSKWYIMFGKVDFIMKAAPGVGMVTSAILLSDDLDEIDWELLGADSSQAQSNYFSKGVTGTYDRGGFSSIPTSQSEFNTYSIDWNADQIVWSINGETMRTLTYSSSGGQYPQSPMQVKVGSWAGGDSTNPEGTIEWAGGPIDYASGPYSMYVQAVNVQDYSTGSAYRFDGTSGSWQDITAVGGSIGSQGTASSASVSDSTPTSAEAVTKTWAGTHKKTSAFSTPNTYPWVPSASAQAASASASAPPASSYLATLGVKSTTNSAHVTSHIAASSPSPSPSRAAALSAAAGCEIVTTYDDQGFPITLTVPAGWSTMRHYDDNGALITPTCGGAVATAANVLAAKATTLATVTTKPLFIRPQANVAANIQSSQAPDDRVFYQTTEPTAGANSSGNGAERKGTGIALLGFVTAAIAFAL